jgi:hypothetical protein
MAIVIDKWSTGVKVDSRGIQVSERILYVMNLVHKKKINDSINTVTKISLERKNEL